MKSIKTKNEPNGQISFIFSMYLCDLSISECRKRWKKNSKIYLPIKEQKNDLRPKSEQTHKPNGKIMKFQIFFSDLISVDLLLFLPLSHSYVTAATFKSNLFAIIIFHAISPRIPECVLASLCWWRIESDFPQRSSNWFKSMLNRVECLLLHFFIFFILNQRQCDTCMCGCTCLLN